MRLTKKQRNKQKITMTVKELEKVRRNATDTAVKITNLFPIWILRTKYGFGEKRLREFMEQYAELLDAFNKEYVSLPDIAKQLEKETGIRLDEEKRK